MGSLAIRAVCMKHVAVNRIKEKCTQDFGAEIQTKEFEDLDTCVRINVTFILLFC
jgi:hypothetical protein